MECPEPLGAEYYRQITNDVLLDHNLLKVIEKLHIYIDPKVPVFIAVGTLRKITTIVRVRDFANVNPLEGKITLVISDETYLAPMLKIFWEKFGKEQVEQPDRFTVILYDVKWQPRGDRGSGGCRPERVPLQGPDLRVPVHCAGRLPARGARSLPRRSSRLLQARTRLPRISMHWLQRSSP